MPILWVALKAKAEYITNLKESMDIIIESKGVDRLTIPKFAHELNPLIDALNRQRN